MILQGENELRTGGIKVPENSKLTIEGEGNLFVDCNFDNYFGVGNAMDKRHGDIRFEQAGTVEVQGNGTLGVGVGSGLKRDIVTE